MKRLVSGLLFVLSLSVPAKTLAIPYQTNCFSELAEVSGTVQYGNCIPTEVFVPRDGSAYALYMKIGIDAGSYGDYDTAIINFQRALSFHNDANAIRGLKAAVVAKYVKENPEKFSSEVTDYLAWVLISGTKNHYD